MDVFGDDPYQVVHKILTATGSKGTTYEDILRISSLDHSTLYEVLGRMYKNGFAQTYKQGGLTLISKRPREYKKYKKPSFGYRYNKLRTPGRAVRSLISSSVEHTK
jgi:hypothetical protein